MTENTPKAINGKDEDVEVKLYNPEENLPTLSTKIPPVD